MKRLTNVTAKIICYINFNYASNSIDIDFYKDAHAR